MNTSASELSTVGPYLPPMGGVQDGYAGSAMVRFADTVTRTAALDAVSVVAGVLSGFSVRTRIGGVS